MIKFPLGMRMLVTGSSGSGKSFFVANLLSMRDRMIDVEIDRIVYCAKFPTSIPENLRNDLILEFHQGCPSEEMLENEKQEKIVYVLDDLLESAFKSKTVSEMFTQGRNRGIGVILLTQNIFPRDSMARNISLNCNFMVIFRNIRDRSSFNHLSRQLLPANSKNLSEFFLNCVAKPFSYLLIDLTQECPEALRFRQEVFNEDFCSIISTNDEIKKLENQAIQKIALEL